MGLRGPQGAQGLPGLAGTAPLRVLDANGVEVGRVIGVGSGVHYSARMVYPRVLLQAGNDLFAVHVTRGHLIGDVDNATLPRFTSSDCSGPAFVSGSPEHLLPSVSVLSVSGGFDVYLPDLDAGATSVTLHSYLNVGGECIVNTLTRAYFPSRPVIHLSFVAPFSVEFVP